MVGTRYRDRLYDVIASDYEGKMKTGGIRTPVELYGELRAIKDNYLKAARAKLKARYPDLFNYIESEIDRQEDFEQSVFSP